MDPLTVDDFKKALPKGLQRRVDPELIKSINEKLSDPDMYAIYRENLLSYTHVMQQGKFRLTNYIDAVCYVSHKLREKSSIDAYSLTFPEKIKEWTNKKLDGRYIASYVSAYNKSKLVNLIYEQTITPAWVLNQDVFQKAINKQVNLMNTAKSEKVQMEAANSLLNHLRPPEAQKIELSLGEDSSSAIAALKASTAELASTQKKLIESGAFNAEQIAQKELVIQDGEYEEIKNNE